MARERGYLIDKPAPKNKYWLNGALKYAPEVGILYHYIDAEGFILWNSFHSDSVDLFRLHSQNMFDTEEAAEKALAMKKRKHEILSVLLEIDRDWEPKWCFDNRFYLSYDHENRIFTLRAVHFYYQCDLITMSREAINHLLSDRYTDQDRAAFMEDVKLWKKFGGKV